jgi:acyl carrier protein
MCSFGPTAAKAQVRTRTRGGAVQIEREVREFIAKEVAPGVRAVKNHESLLEAGVIDSLGVLSLVSFIERRYRIAVSEDDMMPENFDSIDAIAGFIVRRLEPERV